MTLELERMILRRIPKGLERRFSEQDVVQGGFLRLGMSLTRELPDSEATCRAWIIRSVLSEWLDYWRRHVKAKCRSVLGEEVLPAGSVHVLLGGIGVSTDCGLKEVVERIREAIKPAEFEIVWMRAVDGFRFAEIAAVVGKSEDTVTKCHARALDKIRKAVASPFSTGG